MDRDAKTRKRRTGDARQDSRERLKKVTNDSRERLEKVDKALGTYSEICSDLKKASILLREAVMKSESLRVETSRMGPGGVRISHYIKLIPLLKLTRSATYHIILMTRIMDSVVGDLDAVRDLAIDKDPSFTDA